MDALFFCKEGGDWFEQELSPEDILDVQCDSVRLNLTLDDLYEGYGTAGCCLIPDCPLEMYGIPPPPQAGEGSGRGVLGA